MRWLPGLLPRPGAGPRSVVAGAALLLLAGCVVPNARAGPPEDPVVLGDDQVAPLVAAMVQRTPKELPAPRLAEGLTPPTNRWYSGLVFGDEPMPVFPLPLSFALTEGGFEVGLPRVTTTEKTIAGGHVADLSVGVGAETALVSSDDPSVLTVDDLDADGDLIGRTTLAQGSPFVAWTAARASAVTIPAGFSPAPGGLYLVTVGDTTWALLAQQASVDGTTARVDAGGRLVFWPVPEGHDPAELAAAASHILTGSSVGYRVGDGEVSTTLSYQSDGETVMARLPHQASSQACDLGSYPSIYGTLQLCAGSSLTWATPRTAAATSLDLGDLAADDRDRLATQLRADVAALPAFPADTYFGGKALQRTAMLLAVADQLGLSDEADTLAEALDGQLSAWTQPGGCDQREAFCFVYDPAGRGLVGLTPSFGSEEYNDHHFHYGYFLYAAGVLAAHDPSVVARYAPVMTLVAADIASSGSSFFPDRRAFDVYASHSWASGTAPFGDGNNQESVSEAVNAYAGLELWADAAGEAALADEAAWMLSLEAQSSTVYWTNPDLSGPEFVGYGHQVVSLNWGGKRDYATWFSPEPAAMLGILLLPMSPSSGYLAGDPDRIRANVAEATGGDFDQKFGDYLLMYSALAGEQDRQRALAIAPTLSDATIDDGLSRTWLLAWLLATPS